MDEWFLSVSGIVSSTAAFSEKLHVRNYQAMQLKTRIYTDEDHYTVVPRVVGDGIRYLWRDEASKLGSSWP